MFEVVQVYGLEVKRDQHVDLRLEGCPNSLLLLILFSTVDQETDVALGNGG
jgi:hypothetical protein